MSYAEPVSAARLAAIIGQTPMIVPFAIGKLSMEFSSDGSIEPVIDGALVVIGAQSGRFVIEMPEKLLDLILADAPEPVALRDLSENDCGLLLEHIATPLMEQIEALIGEDASIVGILRNEAIGPEFEPIGFTLTHREEEFPCAFFASDDRLRGKVAALITAHNQTARAVQKGDIVAMGPVVLSQAEADAITVGDVIVMEGAKFGRLTGAFLFPDGSRRAADLADGFASLLPPEHGQSHNGIPVYFEVGSSARAGSGQTGTRIQFMPFQGHKIFISINTRRVGTGELVDAGGSLAISVKTMGDV